MDTPRFYYKHVSFLLALMLTVLFPQGSFSQGIMPRKMSSYVIGAYEKNLRRDRKADSSVKGLKDDDRRIIAFIRLKHAIGSTLEENGCEVLASFGDIYIASIPLNNLGKLSMCDEVLRIEANKPCSITLDETAVNMKADKAYAGISLPQAFTGKGVVVGIQDIGFDLTHPTFFNSPHTQYRIKRLWDQILPMAEPSDMPVGKQYTTEAELLALGCPYDGRVQTHGTHTAGIAAGSGYNSLYRGLAWESDLCLVCNATGDDANIIPEEDHYKYTTATDALGFKYIFDYAASVGKPCVISFSEGEREGLGEDEYLFQETLSRLVGEGRILVASAGNEGGRRKYAFKAKGDERCGVCLADRSEMGLSIRTKGNVDVRFTVYSAEDSNPQLFLSTSSFSTLEGDTLRVQADGIRGPYAMEITSASTPFGDDTIYDIVLKAGCVMGTEVNATFEIVRSDEDAELFCNQGRFYSHPDYPSFSAAQFGHDIHSPSCAPRVISVGANSYRTQFYNYKGELHTYDQGTDGMIGSYSSKGPSRNGLVKPDVVAPGTNIISSYSSFYLENNPNAGDISSDVEHFTYEGRTYAWNANSGTSMSSPVVGGIIALWLQANPNLTPEDVLGIISRTSRHPDTSLSYPNNDYGHGEIDAYAGLLDILGIDKVEGISHSQPSGLEFKVDENGILRVLSENKPLGPLAIRVYNVSGSLIMSENISTVSDSVSFSLKSLPKGVYAVQIDGKEPSQRGSSLIRLM